MNLSDRFLDSAGSAADAAGDRARLAATGSSGPSLGTVILAGALGVVAGAAATLLLDPARGRARRARLLDQGAAAVRQAARRGEQVVRHARSEVDGRVAAIRAERSTDVRPVDDATLTDRVQSILFRDDAIPKSSLNVNVERGIVVLRGEIPDESLRARMVSEVERIEGVWSVRDLLHLPGETAPTGAGGT